MYTDGLLTGNQGLLG